MLRSDTITRQELCGLFDHTLLKAFATGADFKKLCSEAAEHHFAMVAVNSGPTALCKDLLAGSGVHVGAAIAFPLGQTTIEAKVFETENAIQNGADEIDYVINIGALRDGRWDYLREEMESIVRVCRRAGVLSKVIFENCYLTAEEKKTLPPFVGLNNRTLYCSVYSLSFVSIALIIFAGLPPTIVIGGTSCVTTLLAPMIEP